MRALNLKLLRDLRGMKGQAIAIAMVVAAGVAMFVMYLSNFDSLRRTQRAYYERQRFGDVFVSLKRAPEWFDARLASLPGVATVETRVVADVTLDVPGLAEPATGRLISVPAGHRPRLDDVFLRQGRWVSADRPEEVLASEAFVEANGLRPGDQVSVVINGRWRRLTIVGVALSPEYVYSIRAGEIVPDDRRFGVFWMERKALANAFDMEGAFNDAVLSLTPGAPAEDVITGVDRLLAPYGGRGAIRRALQPSHWTLENELMQLQNFGFLVPLIFLLVAAFVLNVALARALALQRPQIASLKALGYGNGELAWHYLKWALLIAAGGALAGVVAGRWLGERMLEMYNHFFRFPALVYHLSWRIVVWAFSLSLGAAAAGAYSAVRRAVSIPPAEAMRPEPPARYRRSLLESTALGRRLTTTNRMVLRNIGRHPFRAAASIAGIACATAILVVGFVFVDALEALIRTEFTVAERQDVSLSFFDPRSPDVRFDLGRLPGVLAIEPQRVVAARLRAGHRYRNLAIVGSPPDPQLRRIVDRSGRPRTLPPEGMVLSQKLGDVLGVAPGDMVQVEVLEGWRPTVEVRVVGLVDDTLGLSAYMDIDALHRLMRETDVLSGASMLIDSSQRAALATRLKQLPAVAGVAFKSAVVENFRGTLTESMRLVIILNVVFAGIIAFGVVYNAARVSLSERSRELASLRVLGFTRAEISLVLLGELAALTLAALPAGSLLGHGLAVLIAGSVGSEVYRFPMDVTRQAVAWGCLWVIAAAVFSGLVVRRRLDELDLVAVLKIRE